MLALAVVAAAVLLVDCQAIRRLGVRAFSDGYSSGVKAGRVVTPTFADSDAEEPRVSVQLSEVASGFTHPTDVKPVPTRPDVMVVLEKAGVARWVSLSDRARGTWLEREVLTVSEQGLLGIAFHPDFADNGLLYLNATVAYRGHEVSEVSAYRVPDPSAFPESAPERQGVVLRVRQPYQNHNGGQLQFGPDGYLYVGFGDGGFQDDPHGHGQDTSTLLGSMVRIDVNGRDGEQRYRVPDDNPFVGRDGVRPEIWAYGLRNPWRYTFGPEGRLIVADVGQNAWEEIDIVHRGDNLGWSIKEGRHCFETEPPCDEPGLTPPIHEYSHEQGMSVTGGHVYTGTAIEALRGKYVFGDFVSGRLWAIDLPPVGRLASAGEPHALGQFDLLPVTMARDADDELIIADYGGGSLYRLEPRQP